MSKRVLVIEDDDSARDLCVVELSRAGYALTLAETGEAAVSALTAEPGAFAAIVCDVALPGLSGVEALRAAGGAALGGAHVLFLSGYDHDGVALDGAGRSARLTKPFAPGALAQAVGQLID